MNGPGSTLSRPPLACTTRSFLPSPSKSPHTGWSGHSLPNLARAGIFSVTPLPEIPVGEPKRIWSGTGGMPWPSYGGSVDTTRSAYPSRSRSQLASEANVAGACPLIRAAYFAGVSNCRVPATSPWLFLP